MTAMQHMVAHTRATLMEASRLLSRLGMLAVMAAALQVSGQSRMASARASDSARRSERGRAAVVSCSLAAARSSSSLAVASPTPATASSSAEVSRRPPPTPPSLSTASTTASTAAPTTVAARIHHDTFRFLVSSAARASHTKAVVLVGSHQPSVLWLRMRRHSRARCSQRCEPLRMPGLSSVTKSVCVLAQSQPAGVVWPSK